MSVVLLAAAATASRGAAASVSGEGGLSELGITTSSLPNATEDSAYSQMVAANGGQTPYTWSIVAGSLGDLSINSSTGEISGTPTTDTDLSFTVRVTDDNSDTADQALTITVNAASGAADFEIDFSDYADVAAVIAAHPGSEVISSGNGSVALVSVSGQPFTKALQCTHNTPASIDQQQRLTLSIRGWADTAQPRETWQKYPIYFSSSPAFSWGGPLSGGGPGGKLLLNFDQDQLGTSRREVFAGQGGATLRPQFAGSVGTGNTTVEVPENEQSIGQWGTLWVHDKFDDANGLNEVMLEMGGNTYYAEMGTGVDSSPSASHYLAYLGLLGNINNGCENDGMHVRWGKIQIWKDTKPSGWPTTGWGGA